MAARVELVIADGRRVGDPPSGGPPQGGGAGGGPGDELPAGPVYGSEIYLADQLRRRLAGDWRCAAGQWHQWDGTRWKRDDKRRVWNLSRQVCSEVASFFDSNAEGKKIERRNTIYAAVTIAEAYEDIAIAPHEFDADPWLLNTPDGIVDLRSGQLLPHQRERMMSKMAGAGPMPRKGEGEAGQAEFRDWLDKTAPNAKLRAWLEKYGASCPHFMRYLCEATGGDLALMQYLQRVAGYCLTGSIEEHCILFFYGPGGSGKSTFLLVLQDMLGDYAVTAPMGVFCAYQGERHPTELARMAGARIVTASEVDEGQRWDEAKLKSISGGDKITARFMRQDDFTFEPNFKLLMAGNHRPRMRSADSAMLRRWNMVPFRLKPSVIDKQLRDKLRTELGAILRWAIEGTAEWLRRGALDAPAAVVNATNEYFRDENTLGRWIDERCENDANFWSETRALYRDYRDWAKRVGEYELPERSFVQKLEQMPGCERAQHPTTRRSGFRGLRLPYATADLFEGGQRPADPWLARDRSGTRVDANRLPLQPPDDPGEEWERE